ncbi:MAG: efflux RND transporter periplasmic adaptor subunit [Cyclobacteriaceae bacterium]
MKPTSTQFFSSILFLFQLLLVSCGSKEQSEGPPQTATTNNEVALTAAQYGVLHLELGGVTKHNLSASIQATGMLDVPPKNLVSISAPLGGFVKRTELLQGMKVQRGQILITLEHPDYIQLQQDYLDGKSQLLFSELEFHRQEELARENINAQKTLQQSKSRFLSLKAQVEGLAAKLAMIHIDPASLSDGVIQNEVNIPSPTDGYVSQISVNIGMHVTPNDVMLKIVDTQHLHAEVQVYEKDVPRIRVGQKAVIRLSSDAKERMATVYLIGKEFSADRTVRVHCHLDQEDASLIPGSYFNASIETGSELVATLPVNAIVNYAGKQFVFWEKDSGNKRYQLVPVSTSTRKDDFVAVNFGDSLLLKDIDGKIVINGSYDLLNLLRNIE